MRFHRDHLVMRLSGTLVGVGFLLFGALAANGPGIPTSAERQDVAFWFGVQLLVAGAVAVQGAE